MKNSDIQDMGDLKKRNKDQGFYFWSRDTVKFFNSKNETGLIDGHLFIYSIRRELSDPKIFKVGFGCRSGRVAKIGPEFDSKSNAMDWIAEYGNNFRDSCDGGFCESSQGDHICQRYPLHDNSSAFLCFDCWHKENEFRANGTEDDRPIYCKYESTQAGYAVVASESLRQSYVKEVQS